MKWLRQDSRCEEDVSEIRCDVGKQGLTPGWLLSDGIYWWEETFAGGRWGRPLPPEWVTQSTGLIPALIAAANVTSWLRAGRDTRRIRVQVLNFCNLCRYHEKLRSFTVTLLCCCSSFITFCIINIKSALICPHLSQSKVKGHVLWHRFNHKCNCARRWTVRSLGL